MPASKGSGEHRSATNPFEAARRQRALLVRATRASFVILVITVTLLSLFAVGRDLGVEGLDRQFGMNWWVVLSGAIVFSSLVLAIDVFTPRKKIATISGVLFGLLVGLAATVALGFIIDLVVETWMSTSSGKLAPGAETFSQTAKVLLGISLCYLGITTVLQTQDDFRLVIPYVEFAKQIRGMRPLVLDSSAIIDGRLIDIAQTGFIQAPLVIPHFVVAELQLLADSSDRMKRTRGRRGLDIIARLQRFPAIDVSIDETSVPGKAVDQLVVELARQMNALVVTTDSGLARVAAIQGVAALNLNDLANALKPSVLAGEAFSVRVVRPGEQPAQGVGYLDDGTMVVVEDGADALGREIQVTVSSTLQTSAGRLIFARQHPLDDTPERLSHEPSADPHASTPEPSSPPRERIDPRSAPQTPSSVNNPAPSADRGPRRRGPQGRNPRR
jgi:uncharacterized protein YacL